MKTQSVVHTHIEVTDTLARLYLFMAQSMDRRMSEADYDRYPRVFIRGSETGVCGRRVDGSRDDVVAGSADWS